MRDYIEVYFGDYSIRFPYDWWIAPYIEYGKAISLKEALSEDNL